MAEMVERGAGNKIDLPIESLREGDAKGTHVLRGGQRRRPAAAHPRGILPARLCRGRGARSRVARRPHRLLRLPRRVVAAIAVWAQPWQRICAATQARLACSYERSATVSAPSFASLSFDEKLDRLAEVAVRVGLGLRAGQELVLTAPIEALPLVRRITDHAYRAGALLVTTLYADDPCVLVALRARARCQLRLRPRLAAGCHRHRVQQRRGAHGHRRNQSRAARRPGPGQSGARQCRRVEGRQARHGTHHPSRDQLDHRRGSHARVGQTGLPRRARRHRRGQAMGGHLPRLAHHRRRSGRRLAGPRRAAEAARRPAEREALLRPALQVRRRFDRPAT